MSNKLTIIIIILSIVIFDFVFLLLLNKPTCEPKIPAVISKTVAKWPIFRGNKELHGYVKRLPNKAVAAWSFRAKEMVDAGVVGQGNKIYFGDSEGSFYCLNINTGEVVWEKKISDGFSASALLISGICYVGSQSGEFFALSMADGKILWSYKVDGQINGSANFFYAQDKLRIVFGAYDFKLHCLDAKSGKELWNVPTENYINGTPAVDGERIVFGGCDGYLRSVVSGKEKPKLKLNSYIPASPAIYDSITYVGLYEQKVFAVDSKNKILWTYDSGNESTAFLSSPALNNEFVVIAERDGLVHILKRLDGKKTAEFQTTGDITVGPVISDKKALVADKEGFIYIIDLNTGKEIWNYQIGPAITAPISVCGNKIIIADNDGNITAFNGIK